MVHYGDLGLSVGLDHDIQVVQGKSSPVKVIVLVGDGERQRLFCCPRAKINRLRIVGCTGPREATHTAIASRSWLGNRALVVSGGEATQHGGGWCADFLAVV